MIEARTGTGSRSINTAFNPYQADQSSSKRLKIKQLAMGILAGIGLALIAGAAISIAISPIGAAAITVGSVGLFFLLLGGGCLSMSRSNVINLEAARRVITELKTLPLDELCKKWEGNCVRNDTLLQGESDDYYIDMFSGVNCDDLVSNGILSKASVTTFKGILSRMTALERDKKSQLHLASVDNLLTSPKDREEQAKKRELILSNYTLKKAALEKEWDDFRDALVSSSRPTVD